MIVDAHMHIFRAPNWSMRAQPGAGRGWVRWVRWYDMPPEEAQRRYLHSVANHLDPDGRKTLARMDEAGCDVSVMMPMDRGLPYNDEGLVSITDRNEGCYELTQLHPGRLSSFCGVDPRRPYAADLLRRGLREWGMKGLKLYPPTGFYPDDEIVYPLYKICAEHDVPVLFHQGHSGGRLRSRYAHPMYVDTVAADFPELRLVLGHGGQIQGWGHEALAVAIYKTNVHIEFSLWQHWASVDELVQTFVWIRDRIGIDRLIFGSDMTNVEVSLTLKQWVDTVKMFPEWAKQRGYRLSADEIDLVLGGNAARAYNLPEMNRAATVGRVPA
jgi:predicted TIM-barrel fold metal-dependent hydrolase